MYMQLEIVPLRQTGYLGDDHMRILAAVVYFWYGGVNSSFSRPTKLVE
jgi:hypothetical protein